jgi:hypothetical protein
MADHVDGVSAPDSLAADAQRGYRKKVRVRMAVVSAAALAVVFAAGMPAYHAFRPEPVGAEKSTPRQAPAGAPAPPTRKPVEETGSPSLGRRATPIVPPAEAAPASPGRKGHGGVGIRSLLTYLPPGMRPSGSCTSSHAGSRTITICRWTGSGKLIELRLVRGHAFGGPADLGYMPPVATMVRVHDQPAIRGDWPDYGSQVSWVERPDIGVWVGVGPTLDDQLMRIAEGVRVPS